jgi:hypothetical protein
VIAEASPIGQGGTVVDFFRFLRLFVADRPRPAGLFLARMTTMRAIHSRFNAHIAVVTSLSLIGSSVAPLVAAQAPKAATKTAAKTTPATAAPVDGGWPRSIATASGAALTLYQPQIATWADQKHVVAYSAVSYAAKGAAKPALGTLKVEADTSVAVEQRLVNFANLKIVESNFPTLERDQLRTAVAEITTAMPLADQVIALDRVLANIDTSQIIPKNVEGVKADPPPIFFSKTPAILVNIDSDPIWSPIENNDLMSAVNTNWDLFQHAPSKTYYLRNDKMWLKAAAVKGPWAPAGTLPASFQKLPADANWKDVKESLPGQKISASQVPKVFVSTQPAEMILLQGEPNYLAVSGATPLLWVSNTESDLFRAGLKGSVYFLVAGRWFSAPDFTGPWTFATPSLPAEFKKIPLEHTRSRVLASVPGTTQAAEAILLAQIPQTATVSKTLAAPEVTYQGGAPDFQPIEKTTAQRAVNTDKDILKVGDLYYMCFQGVWFMSTTPTGPWKVTGDVPKTIYEIPVSSPAHSVTYVTVQESNDDAVVFATAMAATGMMVAFGCVVWGSGYYYPPYYGYGGRYPYYYPHYPTYGYGASYNPWTGAYSRGAVAYGPYGGAGVGQRYNPRTGTYSRGAVAYGPYGARGAASAYNPRTGAVGATRQGSNVYGSWGATGVQRGDQWAATARSTNNATGVTTRRTETSAGSSARVTGPGGNTAAIAKGNNGDVYAGRDGNVYKKSGDSWQKYGGDGNWNNVQQPTQAQRTQAQNRAASSGWDSATAGQVQRDSAARAEGTQRTRDYSSAQSSGARASSYRSSGGGARAGASRGGGGRRR